MDHCGLCNRYIYVPVWTPIYVRTAFAPRKVMDQLLIKNDFKSDNIKIIQIKKINK